MPRFSVIIPCYNRAQYLSEAIESVLRQTINSFEIIVVDDGSVESEAQAIAAACGIDDRIQLIQKPDNTGVAASRNLGIKHASGDYICFLDSDDQFNSKFLTYALDCFEGQPEIDISICRSAVHPDSSKSLLQYHILKETLKVQPHRRPYRKDNAHLLYQYPPQINSMVFRKAIFQQHQFEKSLFIGEDIHLWFRILEAGFTFGKKVNQAPLAYVRVHNHIHLSQPDHQQILDFQYLLRTEFGKMDRSLKTLIDFKLFMRYVLIGDYKTALKKLLHSMKNPISFLRISGSQLMLKIRIFMSYLFFKKLRIDF